MEEYGPIQANGNSSVIKQVYLEELAKGAVSLMYDSDYNKIGLYK